jgi:hypothetical protein
MSQDRTQKELGANQGTSHGSLVDCTCFHQMMLKWVIAAVIIYGGFVALLYLAQRSLQYFPERRRTVPSAVGLSKAEEVVLDAADSERVIVWHVPPCDGQPVFLYFHGNGGSLRWREERFHDLIADGSGLVALSYRGYGGSTGHPTEKGLIEDAKAAYAFSVAHYPAERLVLWGSFSDPHGRTGPTISRYWQSSRVTQRNTRVRFLDGPRRRETATGRCVTATPPRPLASRPARLGS